MRAVFAHAANDLRIEEVETPPVGPDDVRVRIAFGGICGSDLHYFNHGGFGAVRLRQPMILGHEISGVVEAVGASVSSLDAGDRVAVSPSLPCNACAQCLRGLQNHCMDMRFYGSAMRMPHIHGAFREALVCRAEQAHKVADRVSLSEAAMAEPLAVCVHAARRAGDLVGKSVLVTGCGPIGALAALAARRAGASEVIVADVADAPLAFSKKIDVDQALDLRDPEALKPFTADKGKFDVAFEASGAPAAVRACVEAVRPRGIIVQLGLGGDMTTPVQAITAKEIDLRGSFRFHDEFAVAVDFIGRGLVDVKPLLSATLPFEKAREAFELAGDRTRAMKVQLAF